MRICTLLWFSLFVLEFFVFYHAEAFVKISVPTAFALITAAVKIKAVWLKAYLGLRALASLRSHARPYNHGYYNPPMGYPHFSRYKRSLASQKVFNPDDLMSAWQELESAAGRLLIFDEESCAKASKSDRKQLPLWGKLLQSEFVSRLNNQEYSSLVSSLIGSMTGDSRACRFTRIITANLIQAAQKNSKQQNAKPATR